MGQRTAAIRIELKVRVEVFSTPTPSASLLTLRLCSRRGDSQLRYALKSTKVLTRWDGRPCPLKHAIALSRTWMGWAGDSFPGSSLLPICFR